MLSTEKNTSKYNPFQWLVDQLDEDPKALTLELFEEFQTMLHLHTKQNFTNDLVLATLDWLQQNNAIHLVHNEDGTIQIGKMNYGI